MLHDDRPARWAFATAAAIAQGEDVVPCIQAIFQDGFGRVQPWEADGVRRALKHASIVGLLQLERTEPHQSSRQPWLSPAFGYAIYFSPDVLLSGVRFVWEWSICIRKEMQGQGYAKRARAAALSHIGANVGWFAGRTQNPIVMRDYRRMGPSFPFDLSYTSAEGRALVKFLQRHLTHLISPEIVWETGIWPRAYKTRLGDYPATGHDDGTAVSERWLGERGFDRSSGDAVVVVVKRSSWGPA